jgi:hypothetical protein
MLGARGERAGGPEMPPEPEMPADNTYSDDDVPF